MLKFALYAFIYIAFRASAAQGAEVTMEDIMYITDKIADMPAIPTSSDRAIKQGKHVQDMGYAHLAVRDANPDEGDGAPEKPDFDPAAYGYPSDASVVYTYITSTTTITELNVVETTETQTSTTSSGVETTLYTVPMTAVTSWSGSKIVAVDYVPASEVS